MMGRPLIIAATTTRISAEDGEIDRRQPLVEAQASRIASVVARTGCIAVLPRPGQIGDLSLDA